METIKKLFNKYYEAISYLFFGGLATLLNIAIAMTMQATLGSNFAAGVGNVLNNAICILFAYFTNRTWVFKSRAKGAEAWKEFVSFVTCRIGTAVADQLIMWFGVIFLGPRLTPAGFFTLVILGFGKSVSFSYEQLWYLGVKLFSQVVVIVSNYVFSKLFIFKNKEK